MEEREETQKHLTAKLLKKNLSELNRNNKGKRNISAKIRKTSQMSSDEEENFCLDGVSAYNEIRTDEKCIKCHETCGPFYHVESLLYLSQL